MEYEDKKKEKYLGGRVGRRGGGWGEGGGGQSQIEIVSEIYLVNLKIMWNRTVTFQQ